MELIGTPLSDLKIVKGDLFGDERGFFLESFNDRKLKNLGLNIEVKQINFAKSEKGVLRGLHYQKGDDAQAKLVGCISGAVRDVVVDIRPESPTYLEHFCIDITSADALLYVPKGFAHGYYTLKKDTLFYYAVDNFYNPEQEGGIRFDDPKLGIDWKFQDEPFVSQKDLSHKFLN